jgi:hypothetical protein
VLVCSESTVRVLNKHPVQGLGDDSAPTFSGLAFDVRDDGLPVGREVYADAHRLLPAVTVEPAIGQDQTARDACSPDFAAGAQSRLNPHRPFRSHLLARVEHEPHSIGPGSPVAVVVKVHGEVSTGLGRASPGACPSGPRPWSPCACSSFDALLAAHG